MTQSATALRYLALGDSYTIGESVAESERWPNQLVDSLGRHGKKYDHPQIIATTGWRTDDLRRAMDGAGVKPTYDLVSLLIGVNNQYQGKSMEQYGVEFEGLLEYAIRLTGGRRDRVFVVSIPDYGFTPFGLPKQYLITAAIDRFNLLNKSITERLGVQYISITDISRRGLKEPELVAGDGLHPSGKMYSLWVERIVKELKR